MKLMQLQSQVILLARGFQGPRRDFGVVFTRSCVFVEFAKISDFYVVDTL